MVSLFCDLIKGDILWNFQLSYICSLFKECCMQSVTINTRKYKSRHDLEEYLKGKHLVKGDKVEIISTNADPFSSDAAIIITLMVLAFALAAFLAFEKKTFVDNLLENLFENEDINLLEKEIEKEFGVEIEVKQDFSDEIEEKDFWTALGSQSFQRAYGENEPDYNDVKVLEPNPKYGK